jgi:hypothetical protein
VIVQNQSSLADALAAGYGSQVLLRVLKRRGRSLFAERLLLAQLTSEISYVLSSTRIYFILQGTQRHDTRATR